MASQLEQRDLRRDLGLGSVEKGTLIWDANGVRSIEISGDRRVVTGVVSGSRYEPYRQTIKLEPRPGSGTQIRGHCTCPMRFNCKHVAAVLLEYLMDLELGLEGVAPVARLPSNVEASVTPVAVERRRGLSSNVESWLERLASAVAPPADPGVAAGHGKRGLAYVLDHADQLIGDDETPGRIRALTGRIRKDGQLADIKSYDPDNVYRTQDQWPRFITETDVLILRDMAWRKRVAAMPGSPDVKLGDDPASLRILQSALASGRLHYRSLDSRALQAGPMLPAEPRWIKTVDGRQRLVFAPSDDSVSFDRVLPLAPPHYVDLTSATAGAIESTLPQAFSALIVNAPIVSPSEAAQVKELMRQRLRKAVTRLSGDAPSSIVVAPELDGGGNDAPTLLPLPDAPGNVEVRIIAPVPRLELRVAQANLKSSYIWYAAEPRHRGTFAIPVARLCFDYAGDIVPAGTAARSVERTEGDKLIITPRDKPAETLAQDRLAKLGVKTLDRMPFELKPIQSDALFVAPPGNPGVYDLIAAFDDPSRFIAFSATSIPQLLTEGWQVAFSGDYPYRIAEGEAQWWADTGESSGIDWFSFELGIEYDGHRINLVPQLADMLAKMPAKLLELARAPDKCDEFVKACHALSFYHTLPDGRLLPLPGARLSPILKAMIELIGPRGDKLEGGKIKLHRAEAASLAEFAGQLGPDVAWAASSERLMDLGRDLRRGRGIKDVKPPKSFKGALRPYQRDGLAWLDFLRETGFGGVLADDMGLGKTVQALAFLSREKAEGRLEKPALIISPTSVLPNWQSEAARFAPKLSVLALRGLDRRMLFDAIPENDVVLTTYPLLARDHEVLLEQEFHVAILDEAQAIKNPKATVTGLAHRINARHRLALTGTPLENNLGEVWSLFEFLSPGLLGDETTFRRTFRTPIEKHGDQAVQAFLSRRLKPFMLRRTKEAVATELPLKTEIVERIRLEGSQRDLYETVRALMDKRVRDEIASKGIAKSHIVFLDALLKLRQICCDPRLLKMPQARRVRGSAKLERLMEMLPEMVSEGRRILLFSQFTSMLDLIKTELAELKIPYVQITGDTVDRATPVKQFQAGEVPLFLLSLKAGGTGLNLTAADTVIHYDPWWNPAVERQATDRAHRIGQTKPVFVYKMMVEEGIEEAIELLKKKKAALAEALFAGSAKAPLDLTEADISALFAPLDRRVAMKKAA